MQLGRYEIESYYVVIDNQTESRQRIVYIGNNGEDYFIERYYGSIRDGYSQSNTFLRNLNFTDIKSHIPGESIVIYDKNLPPKPMIYIYLSSIQSIERDGDSKMTIIDSQIDPTTLEFLTVFDCDQAYSMLTYVLENKMVDIGTLGIDMTPPVIFFKENFFGKNIHLSSDMTRRGPLSTNDGDLFRIDIDSSKFDGPKTISKDDIISGLIYDITDNRDGSIYLIGDDIIIYKDTISTNNEVSEINGTGNYMIRFNLVDLGRNKNVTTIIISII
jgi:hypothetical protein